MNTLMATVMIMTASVPALVLAQEAAKKADAKVPETVKQADGGLALRASSRTVPRRTVQLEVFEPGDYYETDATAVFLRWEVTAKF